MNCFRSILVCAVVLTGALTGQAAPGALAGLGQQTVLTGESIPAAAQQLFLMTNQARAMAGVGPLRWDAGVLSV